MQKRMQAIVLGRVQLVLFRDFVCRKAKKLKITGWVRNLKDSTVEVLAEGEEENLQKLITFLNKGSFLSEVDEVKEKWWETATGEFGSFNIRYD